MPEVLYALKEEGVARITLNRPDKRNALSPALIGELLATLESARANPAVRAIIVAAEGKIFSAGGDLGVMGGSGDASRGSKPVTLLELFRALRELGKPTIAMVQGHAMAGGLGLVLACDLAIAAEDAQFATPEINVGLWPMMVMAQLIRHVPRKKALALMLTGERIDAREAERLGLLTRVVPLAQLEGETNVLAKTIAAKSPAILRHGLEAFHATCDLALEEALPGLEQRLFALFGTEDAREGLSAFIEKRQPTWKGK